MKIGINILYLIPGKVGGTETYARELIPHLAKDNQLILYCGKETALTFTPSKNIEIVTLPIYSRNRSSRLLAEQTILPLLCKKNNIDVLFSLGYSSPFIHPCPAVVTIHDLNWYYHPEDFSISSRIMWQILTRLSAMTASHIITDSQSSAISIHQVFGTPVSKITPILHGTPATIKTIHSKPKNPYIFTVIANYPHKNLKTLLRAFDKISQSIHKLDLIICGLGKQPSSSDRIKYLGYVSRKQLASLYHNASIFVFPSAYEGFGYPVLEAMSYGAPVVSSRASSLQEVVGDGGILVDPYDIDSYVVAIIKLLDSPRERAKWVKLGKLRASELKWEDTAKSTLDKLRKANSL